jgi:hypothetical protein
LAQNLFNAVKAENEENAAALALTLLSGFLVNVARIANAAEAIAAALAKRAGEPEEGSW